jgi:hypothetical protein
MATQKKNIQSIAAEQPQPTKSKLNETAVVNNTGQSNLVFGKRNFQIMIGGALLILIGLLLMSGGKMPSPDVWDESLIYSGRRTIVAPIFILAGLAAQIVALFSKKQ